MNYNDIYVFVEGRGTAEYCSELNTYLLELLSKIEVEHIYFDTKEACYVDSSFIGLILAMRKKLSQDEDRVFLLNPSDKIIDIFDIMGLSSFIPSIDGDSASIQAPCIAISKKSENSLADIRLLLEAHQNIMETSSENHKRFALVEKAFQKELDQKEEKE